MADKSVINFFKAAIITFIVCLLTAAVALLTISFVFVPEVSAENFDTQEFTLSASRTTLYVSGSDAERTVTITPEFHGIAGERLDFSNIFYSVMQGDTFGETEEALTDFDANSSKNKDGTLTFSLNKNLSQSIFCDTYHSSQVINVFATYLNSSTYEVLSASVDIYVKAYKDSLTVVWGDSVYKADDENKTCIADNISLKNGEITYFTYSAVNSAEISYGNNCSIEISEETENNDGFQNVTERVTAKSVGTDVITVKADELKVVLPISVMESDIVLKPTFGRSFKYFKFVEETLITSDKNLPITCIFSNLNAAGGVFEFNEKNDKTRKKIITEVYKDGEKINFENSVVFAAGSYEFKFVIPEGCGAVWEEEKSNTVTLKAVLGAPCIYVCEIDGETEYDGNPHSWDEFFGLSVEGGSGSAESYVHISADSMKDAGEYDIIFALTESEAFLIFDEMSEDSVIAKAYIEKALVNLTFSGIGVYTGNSQTVKNYSVNAKFDKSGNPADISGAKILLSVGGAVADAGKYPFVSAEEKKAENIISVEFLHKNFLTGSVNGFYIVNPAVITAEICEGAEYDGANHYDEAISVIFKTPSGSEAGNILNHAVVYKDEIPVTYVADAGKYFVKVTLDNSNYVFDGGKKNLCLSYEIRPKSAEIKVIAAGRTYNGSNLIPQSTDEDVTFEFYGIVKENDLQKSDVEISGTAVNAGLYSFSLSDSAEENLLCVELENKNYILVSAIGIFEIFPKTISFSLSGRSVYNGRPIDISKIPLSLTLGKEDNFYNGLFGLNLIEFSTQKEIKNFRSAGYSFGNTDSADIVVRLKNGCDNFTIKKASGVFTVEKAVVTVRGVYNNQIEYGSPRRLKETLSQFDGLSAENLFDDDISVWLEYELSSTDIGFYNLENGVTVKAGLSGKSSENYTIFTDISAFSIEIIKAVIGGADGSRQVTFWFVGNNGEEKPIEEIDNCIYDGETRTVRAYGSTAGEGKIPMKISGNASFCDAGEYTFFALNPDSALYEYDDCSDFATITVLPKSISVRITASTVYNGQLQLPDYGLRAEFSGIIENDGFGTGFLKFSGKAIDAGTYLIGNKDSDIQVALDSSVKNYTLAKAEGVFTILPAALKVKGIFEKSFRYNGEKISTTVTSFDNGLEMQNFASDDGITVTFCLSTSDGEAGIYAFPSGGTGLLEVSCSTEVPKDKADNYISDGNGEFSVDFSEVVFYVNIVMAEIVSVDWYLCHNGQLIPFVGFSANVVFDADYYTVAVKGEYADEYGVCRPLQDEDFSVAVTGATAADADKLVDVKGKKIIRNAGNYIARIVSPEFFVKEEIETVKITVAPYIIELAGHTSDEKGDLLYGDYVLKVADNEITVGTDGSSETVRIEYLLNATYALEGRGAVLDAYGFAHVGVYGGLIPYGIEISSVSDCFDNNNYLIKIKGEYEIKIVPVRLQPIGDKAAVYRGYVSGDGGLFTPEEILNAGDIKFSAEQPHGLDVNASVQIPAVKVEYISGDLTDFNGLKAAKNVGKYIFSVSVINPGFAFGDTQSANTSAIFEITAAEINFSLNKSSGTYTAVDQTDCLSALLFLADGTEITQYFYDEQKNIVSVTENGIWGSSGKPVFILKFYSDPEYAFNSLCGAVKNAGVYYVDLEFCDYVSDNFDIKISRLADVTYTIAPSLVTLETENLDFCGSEILESLPALKEYLVYGGNIKTLLVSTSILAEGETEGIFGINMTELFGKINGFYGEEDGSEIFLTMTTPYPDAGIYTVEINVGCTENYRVICTNNHVKIEILPKCVEAVWKFYGNSIKNGYEFVYDGFDKTSGISASAADEKGVDFALSVTGISLVKDGKTYGGMRLMNTGNYIVSAEITDNKNYFISNPEIEIRVMPFTVTAEIMRSVLRWQNSTNGTLLRDGSYKVEGIQDTVSAINSFAGYKEGVTNIILPFDPPVFGGEPIFVTEISDNIAAALGSYALNATFRLVKRLFNGVEFLNFKWEDGFYESLRGDRVAEYGENISYDEVTGALTVVKKWYVVLLSNELENNLELPWEDVNGDGEFNPADGDFIGWTFGDSVIVSKYPVPSCAEAEMHISFGKFADGQASEVVENGQWQSCSELALLKVLYTSENQKSSDCEIKAFLNYWLNGAVPAGEYAVVIYISESDYGGEYYPPFYSVTYFTVKAAPLHFTEYPLEDFCMEYDGQAHFFKDGNAPQFDNLTGKEIDNLRANTGWSTSYLYRPSFAERVDIDALYGKYGGVYASPILLLGDNFYTYHNISDDSDEWNDKETNSALPVEVKPSTDGTGGKYVLYYKIALKNYAEYVTVNGNQLSRDDSFYSVLITARKISIEAVIGGQVFAVDGNVIVLESGTVKNLMFKVCGMLACDKILFDYKFLPVKDPRSVGDRSFYPDFRTIAKNGLMVLPLPGYVDDGNFILYLILDNYNSKASKSGDILNSTNYVLDGENITHEKKAETFVISVTANLGGTAEPPMQWFKEKKGSDDYGWVIISLSVLATGVLSSLIASAYVKRHKKTD